MKERSMPGDLEGRVCLITGAAGGLGMQLARIFAEEGATLYLCDIRPPSQPLPDSGRFLTLDVSDEESWRQAVEQIDRDHSRLDVLVNSAGLSGAAAAERRFDRTVWDRTLAINSTGPFLGMTTTWPLLRRSSAGAVVNVASIAGLVGTTGAHPAYAASKAALTVLTKVMALEMADDGIRVNCVHPGILPVMSGLNASTDTADRVAADEIRLRSVHANVPMKRMGEYQEISQAVLFLASARTASYVTGADLVVDGGYLAR
jgi:NAD(P)-dependent dehydrogenase (short-subunit alcohol dehydrogenase family)